VTRRTFGIAVVGASLLLGILVLFPDRLGLESGPQFTSREAVLFLFAGIALIFGLLVAYIPAELLSASALVRAVGSRRKQVLFLACFTLGLAVRVALLGEYGTGDPRQDLVVGRHVVSVGLAAEFHGGYFPIQYQEFGSVVALARGLGLREIVVFKSVNLACDLLCLWVIAILLRHWGRNPGWALLYWLTPYVAVLDWLAYVDFQMGLFALLAFVPIAFGRSKADWLVAGIPLGVAVFLKPQALVVLGIVVLYALARIAVDRRVASGLRPALVLVAPACLVVIYSLYFASHGHSLAFLVKTYRDTTSMQAPLSGDMSNIWYVVAENYREQGQPLSAVTNPLVFHKVAKVLTACILAALAWAVARTRDRRPASLDLLLLVTGATLTVPMTMTQAHENHVFLGAMFAAVLVAVTWSRAFAASVGALLLLQFVNVFARYGFGNAHSGPRPLGFYTDPVAVGVAAVCSLLFVVVAFNWASLTRCR
jgi:hypothetical protein